MKLLFDPRVDAVLHDRLDVARPRPERQTVENVQRPLPIVELVVVRGGETGENRQSDDSGNEFSGMVHERWTEEREVCLPDTQAESS